jgi:hypothetical protein
MPDERTHLNQVTAWLSLVLALTSGAIVAVLILRYVIHESGMAGAMGLAGDTTSIAGSVVSISVLDRRGLEAKILALTDRVSRLESDAAKSGSTASSLSSSDAAQLQVRVAELTKEFEAIKSVIVESPREGIGGSAHP